MKFSLKKTLHLSEVFRNLNTFSPFVHSCVLRTQSVRRRVIFCESAYFIGRPIQHPTSYSSARATARIVVAMIFMSHYKTHIIRNSLKKIHNKIGFETGLNITNTFSVL